MTNEERDIITQFIARVSGAQAPTQPSFGGSVPATTTPALPPVDPEADRLIADLFTRYPEARYRITQLAFVQEHALAEAQNRIQRLEWELQQAQQAAQQAQQQQRGSGAVAASSAGCSAAARDPRRHMAAPAWNQGEPQPGYQQAAAAAAIRSRLSARHVPALRLRLPRLGTDDRGRRRRRPGRRQCADEPVLRFARAVDLAAVSAAASRAVGSPWGAAAADQGYVDQGTWDTRLAAVARRIRAMSTTAPGTPPAATIPRGPTTAAAIPALTAAGADRATIRSEPAARACLIEFTVSAPVHALGLDAAQGLHLTESFYWDLNDRTRAFTRRVMPKTPSNTPNMIHAGCYSATLHYLKTVMDMGAGEAKKSGAATVARMKKMPVEDDCFGRTAIREDGASISRQRFVGKV